MYISPDGGATVGYTQDNDKGYVSVAYRKVYLEAGNYVVNFYFQKKLQYLDVDQDQILVSLIPATNTIEPLDYYESEPTFTRNSIANPYTWETTSLTYWSNANSEVTVSATGMYYVVFTLVANEHNGKDQFVAFDNFKITRSEDIKYAETLDGVQIDWTGGYSGYRIQWYDLCDYKYRYDTIQTNSYLIPYTQLREAVYNYTMYRFNVYPICENGKSANSIYTHLVINTAPFPEDTCIAVPTKLKAENTSRGVKLTWQSNSNIYDIRY